MANIQNLAGSDELKKCQLVNFDLRQANENLQKKNNSIIEAYNQQKKDFKSATKAKCILETEVKKLAARLNVQNTKLQSLHKDLTIANIKNAEIEKENLDLRKKLDNGEIENEKLNQKLASISCDYQDKKLQKVKLEDKAEWKTGSFKKYNAQITSLQKELQSARKKCKVVTSDYAKLQNKFEEVKVQLCVSKEKKHCKKCDQKNSALETLQENLKKIACQLEIAKEAISRKENTMHISDPLTFQRNRNDKKISAKTIQLESELKKANDKFAAQRELVNKQNNYIEVLESQQDCYPSPSPSTQISLPSRQTTTGKVIKPIEKKVRHAENVTKRLPGRGNGVVGGKYYCLCGQVFLSPDYLKKHVKLLNQERNFKCQVCPRRFCHFGKLKRHVRDVHEITNALCHFVTGCRSCGLLFETRKNSRDHVCSEKNSSIVAMDTDDLHVTGSATRVWRDD